MDAVNNLMWKLILENADKRGLWVDMPRLWRELVDWALDNEQIFQEFTELAAHGLIVILSSVDGEGSQLLIRKRKWHCPNCGTVAELPSEHMSLCIRGQREVGKARLVIER